ncbi:MAG: lipopolysaccharide biosynthesis protein [Desulfobacteraceae bacterium]|nr:lipopolysaccharide biosynthesis protein [Desulfobacteraceae bacterium]
MQNDQFLDSSHLKKDLYKRSARGGIATLGSQAFIILFDLGRGAVLARLLSPEDYGLQGMLIGIISVALIFKDLGLGTATVRESKISQAQISNLFWANSLIGLVSMLIVMACGPLLSWFFNEPRLPGMAFVVSIGYFFGGLSVQHHALLRRQMLFGRIAVVNISANVLSSLVGIGLGYLGFGYWALVWMLSSMNIFLAVGFAAATGWIPDRPSKQTSIRGLLKVGTDVAALNIFATLAKHMDKILLGKFTSAYSLGIYNRAFTFLNQSSGNIRLPLFNVALPAMSSLQSNPDQFRSYYLKFVSILAFLTMPFAAFCFCFSDEIVRIYLGPKWMESALFLRILSAGAFITPVVTALDQIPLALGHSAQYRNSGIFQNTFTVISIFLGVYGFGAIGAATAISASSYLCLPVFLPWTTHGSPVKPDMYLKTLLAPVAVTGIPVLITEIYRYAFSASYRADIGLALFSILFLFVFFITDYFSIGTDLRITHKAFGTIRMRLSRQN